MTNRFRLHSIRTRLALGAAAFLLFLAAAGYVSLRLSSSYLSDAYGGSMVALSEAMLGEMEQVLGAKLEMLRRFGWSPSSGSRWASSTPRSGKIPPPTR